MPKCDHQIWPWPWSWPRIFKVKYGICFILAKNYPIATKLKANLLFVLQALNVTMRFDLDHDLDLNFPRSNMKFAMSQPKMIRLPQNEKQTYRLNSRHQMQSLGLILAMTLTLDIQGQILNSRISGIGGPIDIEQKGVIHDRDCDLLLTKMRCKDLPDSDRGDFRCRRAVNSSSLIIIMPKGFTQKGAWYQMAIEVIFVNFGITAEVSEQTSQQLWTWIIYMWGWGWGWGLC